MSESKEFPCIDCKNFMHIKYRYNSERKIFCLKNSRCFDLCLGHYSNNNPGEGFPDIIFCNQKELRSSRRAFSGPG
jgi:hypothetical protein